MMKKIVIIIALLTFGVIIASSNLFADTTSMVTTSATQGIGANGKVYADISANITENNVNATELRFTFNPTLVKSIGFSAADPSILTIPTLDSASVGIVKYSLASTAGFVIGDNALGSITITMLSNFSTSKQATVLLTNALYTDGSTNYIDHNLPIKVIINSSAKDVIITAPKTEINAGSSMDLTAVVNDSSGNIMTGATVVWSTDKGSISNTGTLTASNVSSGDIITVTATSGLASSTVEINVMVGPLASIIIIPSDTTITVSNNVQYVAEGFDASDNPVTLPSITWSTNIGSIDANGLLKANNNTGSGIIKAMATQGSITGTATITITPGEAAAVKVMPSDTTVIAGQSVQYKATVTDANGNIITGSTINWNVVNSVPSGKKIFKSIKSKKIKDEGLVSVGTIDPDGLFTADPNVLGTGDINAEVNGIIGVAKVTVIAGPVSSVSVSPTSASLDLGSSTDFTSVALDVNGNIINKTATWTTDLGTIDNTGHYIASTAGSGTVTATIDGIKNSATVTVKALEASAVIVTPNSAVLTSGQNLQLTAKAVDALNNVIPTTFTWSTSVDSIGLIDVNNGLFTAGKVGTTIVTATSSSGLTATSSISVNPGNISTVKVDPYQSVVPAGNTINFKATATDANGNIISDAVASWSLINHIAGRKLTNLAPKADTPVIIGSIDNNGLFVAAKTGSVDVVATVGNISGYAYVQVIPAAASQVIVTPGTATIQVNSTQSFTVEAIDAYGNVITDAIPGWSVSDSTIGTINQNGILSVVKAGNITVRATIGNMVGNADITVNALPVLTKLVVVKSNITKAISPMGEENIANNSSGEAIAQLITYDQYDQPIQGSIVNWIIENTGKASIWLVNTVQIANGFVPVEITAGSTYSISTLVLNPQASTSITLDAADLTKATISASSGGIQANQTISVVWELPVPVELASFNAKSSSSNDVELNWLVASQTNNLGWKVYRSSDGNTFTKVSDLIPGAGTTNESMNYKFTDNNVKKGVYYYYLNQIDIDGTYKKSQIISVLVGVTTDVTLEQGKALPSKYAVSQNYPNPFNPDTHIDLSIPAVSDITVKIYNSNGKLVSTLMSNQRLNPGIYNINWNGKDNNGMQVSSGIYFYKVISEKFNMTKKMTLLR
jgi:hypothetical protein